MIVMKFGGSSIASAAKIASVVEIIRAEIERHPVIVLSAHGKTTDQLIGAAEAARDGVVDASDIERYHHQLISDLELDVQLVEPLIAELKAFLQGVSLIRELTNRTRDQIMSFGERLSVRIVAGALESQGIPAVPVNTFDIGLATDSRHGAATPLTNIDEDISANLRACTGVPVATGFLGCDENGDITTLGRSGSDFTASIIGAAVDAEEVQIWTDVSGVMTCDPSVDSSAQSLPQLSFDEASELAYYGAAVLHPATLVPAIRKSIPVRVLNTMRPLDEGTVVLDATRRTDRFAKSIVYKEDVNLVTLASPRLMSAVQLLSRAFGVLSNHGIGVHMATTSEATVSMVTDRDYSGGQLQAAVGPLQALGEVEVQNEKAIICVVGEELRGCDDALSRIFAKVASQGIKAKMVSQSASEINIAFLVDNNQIEPAVRALHTLIVETP